MATEQIVGLNGSRFEVTLPDGTSFEQAGHVAGQPFVLDGASPALTLHVRYGLAQIFEAGPGHLGTLDLTFRDIAGGGSNDPAQSANGIRGPLNITVHNDTNLPFGAGAEADFIVLLYNTAGDNAERLSDTSGHPVYAHLHMAASADFPGGVHVDAIGGAATGAYTIFGVEGPTVAPGGTVTLPAPSFHQRDLLADDSFGLTVMLGAGSFTAAQFDALEAQWNALHPVAGYDPDVIDWEAVAADYTANWESTGQWWVTPGKFPPEWGVG